MDEPKYKTGLGEEMLEKSRAIFLVLTILVLITSSSAMYAGFKSGEIQKEIVDPVNQLISSVIKEYKAKPSAPTPISTKYINTFIYDNQSDTTDTTETTTYTTTTPVKQPTTTVRIKTTVTTPTPVYRQTNTKSYEERVKEMQEKADADWAAALKRQAELSAESEAKNDAWFEQQKAESQARTEAWKKEHGF